MVSRWFTVLTVVGAVVLVGLSLNEPFAVAWLVLVPILTLTLISLPAAVIAAVLSGAVVVWMMHLGVDGRVSSHR